MNFLDFAMFLVEQGISLLNNESDREASRIIDQLSLRIREAEDRIHNHLRELEDILVGHVIGVNFLPRAHTISNQYLELLVEARLGWVASQRLC